MAAAALLKACALASASFFAQSGRTMSVVTTVLSLTASEVALLLPGTIVFGEVSEDVDDIAEVALLNGGWPWRL